MKKNEIIDLIKNNSANGNKLDLSDLFKLKEVANVDLGIDRNTNEYYYKINLSDLDNKDFDINLILKHSWKLSSNEDFIILYI